MSIQKFREARGIIDAAGGGHFVGAKEESLVAKAESALGVVFPPSYRAFLREMGAGNVKGLEVLGLTTDNFESASVPNGIWLTLAERRDAGLDRAYVLIGEGGDGTYYALDTKQIDATGEAPVYRLSVDTKHRERVADTFGDYFLAAVKRAV